LENTTLQIQKNQIPSTTVVTTLNLNNLKTLNPKISLNNNQFKNTPTSPQKNATNVKTPQKNLEKTPHYLV
jgi:hypothetical protein